VNEIGDPSVEQVPEEGFELVEVGFDIYGFFEETDNPTTTGKPQSIHPLSLCCTNVIHFKSYALCIK
jgi:hypothetical protein